jgi:hypothetical protein
VKTYHPDIIAAMRKALAADVANCGQCKSGSPVSHARVMVGTDLDGRQYAYSAPCDSGSRHYDNATGLMVGRAHCTCDYCF